MMPTTFARARYAFRYLAIASLLVLATYGSCAAAPAVPDSRVVVPGPQVDANRNRLADVLEEKAATGTLARLTPFGPALDLIVCLDHPPGAADEAAVTGLGGKVHDRWDELVCAIHVTLPPTAVRAMTALANRAGVVLVEENAVGHLDLYYSGKQTGVRRAWQQSGFQGDPSQAIAVLDSGIDDTHLDLAGRVVYWQDFTADAHATATDKIGHGTHVSSIAAGTGQAAGIATGRGTVPITTTGDFPADPRFGAGAYFPVDTLGASGLQPLNGLLKWQTTQAGFTNILQLATDQSQLLCQGSAASSDQQPLQVPCVVGPDAYSFTYQLITGSSPSNPTAFSVQVQTPMGAIGDGANLMRGGAPGSKLVALKIATDSGDVTDAEVKNALTWVQGNRATYNIVAVNMSLGFGSDIASLNTAVNNLVNSGVVCVASAGNSRGSGFVFSPASAANCIAVAAISDQDRITNYSSPGGASSNKPDLAAPGGSAVTGRLIAAAHSNDADMLGGVQPFPNSYVQEAGTSMSSPHLAGIAALLAQALNPGGPLSGSQALKTKMILLMTATETNQTAEASPNPTLNRGVRDVSEGFGRVNADAAMEAITLVYPVGQSASATLGALPIDRKAWARQTTLIAGENYRFRLTVPAGADCDLYLYSSTPAANGDPVFAVKSTTAALGGTEEVTYTSTTTKTYYLVVKWVSGRGTFTLQSGQWVSHSFGTGWQLMSVPYEPMDGDPAVIFAGIPLDDVLCHFEESILGYVCYNSITPGEFGQVHAGWGYWLLLNTPTTVSYYGQPPSASTAALPFATAGWHMIGDPTTAQVALEACSVRRESDVLTKPLREAAYTYAWVQVPLFGWSVTELRYWTVGLDGPPLDDANIILPWQGYWMQSNTPNLSFLVPTGI